MPTAPTHLRPLLDDAEIQALIQQAMRWQSNNKHNPLWPPQQKPVARGRIGERLSPHRGGGLDLAETRLYQPGDELRHMNWPATARSGKAHVRVFHEDMAPTCSLFIDRSASMRFGTRTRLKATQAARLATLLAAIESRNGANIAALIYNAESNDSGPNNGINNRTGNTWHPPRSSHAGIRTIAEASSQPTPPPHTTPDSGAKTIAEARANKQTSGLKKALQRLASSSPIGSHIHLISDFKQLSSNDRNALLTLARLHTVRAWIIRDRSEIELPDIGPTRMHWTDTDDNQNESHYVESFDSHSASQRRQRIEQQQQHYQQRLTHLQSAGIVCQSLMADEQDLTALLMSAVSRSAVSRPSKTHSTRSAP